MKIIGVIGGSQCTPQEYEMAHEVGCLIARAGAALVCGGRGGIMEAACRGAAEEGGLTIGILPSDDINEANRYVTVPIATGMGIGRNVMIVRTAQALVAVAGSYGTLSEIAYAMQYRKPIFALKSWPEVPGLIQVETAAEAVNRALQSVS